MLIKVVLIEHNSNIKYKIIQLKLCYPYKLKSCIQNTTTILHWNYHVDTILINRLNKVMQLTHNFYTIKKNDRS